MVGLEGLGIALGVQIVAEAEAGEMGAFWAVMPHQLVHAEPGSASHWLTIPIVMFLVFQRMFLRGAGLGGAVKG